MFIRLNNSNIIIGAKEVSFGLPDEIVISTNLDITEVLGYSYANGQLVHTLESAKREKIKALIDTHNASKKITIQNGQTLIIEHDTPERDIFLDKLIAVTKESLSPNVSISYQQKVNNLMYRFSALPTVWSYIFKDLFLVDRITSDGQLTGFKENVREYNKILFNAIALKIQNTSTVQELNAISWDFTAPNGIVVNVNAKAEQMLNDPSVDSFTKSAINQLKDPETGEIHLINIV